MITRPMKQGLLAVMLATGVAAAHAQGTPADRFGGDPSPVRLDLTLHIPQQVWMAAPGADAVLDAPVNLNDTAMATAPDASEHRLAPGVELLTGYDPYTVFDALDFKPRDGDYAVGLKLDF